MRIPVLEVGGTHVSAAMIDTARWDLQSQVIRRDVDSGASSAAILDTWAAAGADLIDAAGGSEQGLWALAVPDPFDYEDGVGRFHGVGKYESLDGVDVRAELSNRWHARQLQFCNDADAFALGEWVAGAGRDSDRLTGITLGTGVGSGWIAAGRIVDPGVPSGGRIHTVQVGDGGLEDRMSRRAIRRAYAGSTGDEDADVQEIARRADGGEPAARDVLREALRTLGAVVGPLVRDFGAEQVVLGGSMTGSWELFGRWFAETYDGPPVVLARHPDTAGLIGAAYHAVTVTRRR